MNDEWTAICLCLDRSGSMQRIRDSAEEAINGFMKAQAMVDGKRTIRVVQFDTVYEQVHPSIEAKTVPNYKLTPRGGTALLDAMGRSITEFGEELAAYPESERPGHVVYVVMTDGEENSSYEFTHADVQGMVIHQREVYGWNVVFLGANMDAMKVGEGLGVSRGSTMTYAATDHGTHAVMNSIDMYVASASAGPSGQSVTSFTDDDREAAVAEDSKTGD